MYLFSYTNRYTISNRCSSCKYNEGGNMESQKLTIDEWRRAKGISREALAASCSVSVPTIYNWEKNPRGINIQKAFLIADTFKVSILEIDFGI